MGKVGYPLLVTFFCVIFGITHYDPSLLGDENELVKQFVNEQVINILGVVMAIFLPSAATLYLRLAELERDRGVNLGRYKYGIKWNCGSVVALFGVTILLVVVKGAIEPTREFTSAVNGLALLFLLANLLVLVDLTVAMFDVGEQSATGRRAGPTAGAGRAGEQQHGDAQGGPPSRQA